MKDEPQTNGGTGSKAHNHEYDDKPLDETRVPGESLWRGRGPGRSETITAISFQFAAVSAFDRIVPR